MFNPLSPFHLHYLDAFKRKGVKAFVKQTYARGKMAFDEKHLDAFVLVHFENLLAANQYFDVVKEDPARELILADEPAGKTRIRELMNSSRLFTMLTVKDADQKARKLLDKKLRAFIEYKLNWHPSRQDDVIFQLDVQFGEVYARLKFRSKEIKVKLEEIENLRYVL
jgi:hypothetical protein